MLAVAIKEVFRTALTGRCASHQSAGRLGAYRSSCTFPRCRAEAGSTSRGGSSSRSAGRSTAVAAPLDPTLPGWGESRYLDVRLAGTVRLADALNHLYVLLPVLDDAKHYWVSTDEVDKLVRAGGDWLAGAPREGADHPPLPGAQARAHQGRARPAGRGRRPRAGETWTTRLTATGSLEERRPAGAAERAAPGGRARRRPRGRRRSVRDLGCGEGVLRPRPARRPRDRAGRRPPTSPRGRCRSPRAGSGSTR